MSKDADAFDNRFKILLTGDRFHYTPIYPLFFFSVSCPRPSIF